LVKETQWIGRNVDLKLFSQRIRKFFEDDGFSQIRSDEDPHGSWYEIQAMKTGILRTLGSSRKAINIVIKGEPNKFEVEMGVGEWGKNIGIAALLTGGIGLIGLGFDIRFQNKLWNFIKESVDSLSNSNAMPKQEIASTTQDSKFCISCGAKLSQNSRFCQSCGQSQP